jgi:hypothetical protein
LLKNKERRKIIMKTSKIISVLLLAVMLGMLLQACSNTNRGGLSLTSNSSSKADFELESGVKADEMEIKSGMTSHVLKIKNIHVSAGQLTLRLYKPGGALQWEKKLAAPERYQETFNLDITPGIWKLEFELENATGNYNIEWNASN